MVVLVGRIRVSGGSPAQVCGAGVLLASNMVISCRQVVSEALGRTRSRLYVDCPEAPASPRISASVSDDGHVGDLVTLTLVKPAPVAPARLSHSPRRRSVRLFGYPRAFPSGVWVSAELGAEHEPTGWRRLRCLDGTAIEPGLGGAGVHDEADGVLGIVLIHAAATGDAVAWMIPTEGWPAALSRRQLAQAPAQPGGPLTFSDKHALAMALGEVPILSSPEGRRLIVQSLPANIRGAVPNHAVASLELFGLVDAVLAFDGGFEALYSVVATLMGETAVPVIHVRMLAMRLGLLVN
ncbi:effector-associated domain 2-containing protein [Allorhizocola rhizosphaerae]|uniref:effector-associated domain 2-containing protein n=1 Tax=Allorhizocola rhizosphaerae TaxID=1872709 RepID=UPI0013C368C7|nr:hypothetical protein [Allorhizocola rhizosphaerae]